MKTPPPFIDLASLTENQRCRVIADMCAANIEKLVGFVVDNEEPKIARYIRKIQERNPLVIVERIGVFAGGGFALRAYQPAHGKN